MGAVISTLHPFTRIILDYEFSYNLIGGKKRIDSLLSSIAFLGYSILVIYSAVLEPNKTTAKEPNLFSNFYMASVNSSCCVIQNAFAQGIVKAFT